MPIASISLSIRPVMKCAAKGLCCLMQSSMSPLPFAWPFHKPSPDISRINNIKRRWLMLKCATNTKYVVQQLWPCYCICLSMLEATVWPFVFYTLKLKLWSRFENILKKEFCSRGIGPEHICFFSVITRLLSERCGVRSHKTHTIQVSLHEGDEPSRSCSLQTALLSEIKSIRIFLQRKDPPSIPTTQLPGET